MRFECGQRLIHAIAKQLQLNTLLILPFRCLSCEEASSSRRKHHRNAKSLTHRCEKYRITDFFRCFVAEKRKKSLKQNAMTLNFLFINYRDQSDSSNSQSIIRMWFNYGVHQHLCFTATAAENVVNICSSNLQPKRAVLTHLNNYDTESHHILRVEISNDKAEMLKADFEWFHEGDNRRKLSPRGDWRRIMITNHLETLMALSSYEEWSLEP